MSATLTALAGVAFVAAFAVVLRTDPANYRTPRYEATVLGLMLAGIALLFVSRAAS